MPGQPRRYVDAAAFTPLPYNLINYVQWLPDQDPHLGMGMNWQPLCANATSTYDPCIVSGGGTAPTKAATAVRGSRGATPFVVVAEVDCSAPGFWDQAEELSTIALTRAEAYIVEQVFWTGTVAGVANLQMPHLAANAVVLEPSGSTAGSITLQTAATIVSGTVVDVVEGLGLLEQALADCYKGGQGFIHVPQSALPQLQAAGAGMVVKDSGGGGRYRTWNGNWLVPGGGYRGTSPAGVAAANGTTWMYATGPVFGYRGPVRVPARGSQIIDKTNNTVKAFVERIYVLGFDCCHLAIQVSTGGQITGSAGLAT